MSAELNLLPFFLMNVMGGDPKIEQDFITTYAPRFELGETTTIDLRNFFYEFYGGNQRKQFMPHLIIEAAMKRECFVMAKQLIPVLRIVMEEDLKTGVLNSETFLLIDHFLTLQQKALAKKLC